ncbi:MAG: pyridoxamine 5'-phosphate oxidase family protein [Phototrophicaceae bacterium]
MKLTIPKPTRPKMQNYGIEQSNEGLLTWAWVTERLEQSMNYWISSTRPNGNPHAAPIWGILMDDTVYFGTDATSRKAKNLLENPQIVLHGESGFEVVIVEGIAERVTDVDDFERIAPIYAKKYAPHGYEPTAEELAGTLMYRVRPQVVMAWLEQDFPNTATRWVFKDA